MSLLANAFNKALDALPAGVRDTVSVRAFGLTQVPMILYCLPVVEQLDAQGCAVRIPLNWRTRNHFRSMYFGALAVGADVAGGFAAMYHIRRSGKEVGLIFKDFHAEFLKRPEADAVFRTEDGPAMATLVQEAITTGARVNGTVRITVTTPSLSGPTPVAQCALTISLKLKQSH